MSILFPVLKVDWKVSNAQLAALSAATSVGMIVGALSLGALSDRAGRRLVFQLSLGLASLCTLASAFAPDMTSFIVARAFLGVGYGCVGTCARSAARTAGSRVGVAALVAVRGSSFQPCWPAGWGVHLAPGPLSRRESSMIATPRCVVVSWLSSLTLPLPPSTRDAGGIWLLL